MRKADLKKMLDSRIEDARRKSRRARAPISKGREAGREQALQEVREEIFGERLSADDS